MPRRDLDDWLWRIGADLSGLAAEVGASPPKYARSRTWEPNVDISEDESAVIVKAELAGVTGESVRLHFSPGKRTLTIRGTRFDKDVPSDEACAVHQLEIAYGEFEREVRLPDLPLTPDNVSARMHDGFLVVRIGKARTRTKKIVVRTVTLDDL